MKAFKCGVLSICLLWMFTGTGAVQAQLSNKSSIRVVTTTVTRGPNGDAVFTTSGAAEPAYQPSQVLVRFKPGASGAFLPGSGETRKFPAVANLYLVKNPPGLSVSEAVRRYKANPNVAYAEPDYLVNTIATPADPLWSQQWDMTKISAPAAWDVQTSASDVVVAIIDTGIDYTHPDLQGNLWVDPSNAGNHGYTCINGSCSPGGQDDFGHGTHVAGTIGAVSNNGLGMAGINWRIQLLSCKFLDSTGIGQVSDAVLCFNQVAALKQQGINVRVTSDSWGGGGYSQALKDAMLAVEAAGIVNVCAAGNSGQNADVSPMYPAAYDNRGLISVLASDSSDAGAYFTNYGLASVDIAAPGVSTLSTVPTGACSLCDPSGYKLLSGTSMATPHVSGVAAAILHRNPALTAAQLRDVLLDPASYDAVTEPLAQSTSTGGRLNFAKTLSNPLVMNPKLNNFPTLTMPPDIFGSAGSLINITPVASDRDSDPLRISWTKSASSAWLFGWMLDNIFPIATGNSVSFVAPTLARTATVPYYASVADSRGGGSEASNYVTISPLSNPAPPPTGTLSVSSTTPPAGSTITVNFPVADPAGTQTAWDVWVSGPDFSTGSCCYTTPSANVTLGGAGVYRIAAQAVDAQLNLSARQTLVVYVGGATGDAPAAAATLSQSSGPIPLTVNIDMSASYAPAGAIRSYIINCGRGSFTPGAQASAGTCTFTTAGVYWLPLRVQDSNNNLDTIDAYVVATPAGGGGGTAPAVSITNPITGSVVSGNVGVAASASDPIGISKVDFYLDAGILLGTAVGSPYTIGWNAGTVAAGGHTLYAIATDTAGITGMSTVVPITVVAPPIVSLTSPAANATVAGSITLSANASSTLAIKKVDIYLDAGVSLGTATTAPYAITWNSATVAPGGHSLYAIATDTAGNTGKSATVPVTVVGPPRLSISTQPAGPTVERKTSVTISAAVTSGGYPITRADFLVNGSIACSDTASPYTCVWQVPAAVGKTYQLTVKACDTQGQCGSSNTIILTSN